MLLGDLVPLLPVLLVLGVVALKFLSSRAALRYERMAAEKLIREFRGHTTDGTLFIDGSVAKIIAGTEDVKYGFFSLEHYSRRFLLEHANHKYLAVVTMGQAKPFIKPLDAQRGDLVSEFREWKRAGAA